MKLKITKHNTETDKGGITWFLEPVLCYKPPNRFAAIQWLQNVADESPDYYVVTQWSDSGIVLEQMRGHWFVGKYGSNHDVDSS